MMKSPSQNDAFKQGDFDGLCGVYSILNAVNIVVPETSRTLHRVYFARLLAHIVRSMNPSSIVRGLGPRQMWSLIDRTRSLVQSQQGAALMIEWAKAENASEAWEVMRDNVSRNSVVIVGLSGPIEHWTVVADINRRYASFADSGCILGLSVDGVRKRSGRASSVSIDKDAIFVTSSGGLKGMSSPILPAFF